MSVGKEYEDLWNFPHCIGAIDGKHVQLQAPIGSGSSFFNYKSTFSIVLMAVVDADYNFLYADVSCHGRISDGGVFRNTSFFKQLEEQKLEIPPAEKLIGREKAVPYVFVADEAFPFKENILRPYPGALMKRDRPKEYLITVCLEPDELSKMFLVFYLPYLGYLENLCYLNPRRLSL